MQPSDLILWALCAGLGILILTIPAFIFALALYLARSVFDSNQAGPRKIRGVR